VCSSDLTLPSGSLRVVVYAGLNPVTKQRHYLTEVIPAGPRAGRLAEAARTRLLSEVDEKRNARTNATVEHLLARHLDVLQVEDTTRAGYERVIRLYIVPVLGSLPIGRLDGETIDAFYAQLRTCRSRCGGRQFIEHRAADDHACDERCRPHQCRPLGEAYLRQIHNVLSGALSRAVKWRWISVNPMTQAQPPSPPTPDPHPPTAAQAARIAEEAWRDPDWGMFVWLAMTTGARRGELCALRWEHIDFAAGVVTIRASIAQNGGRTWEKDTKTHQRRRIVLDVQTLSLLRAYLRHCADRAAALDSELLDTAFVFSPEADGSIWPKPDSATRGGRDRTSKPGTHVASNQAVRRSRHPVHRWDVARLPPPHLLASHTTGFAAVEGRGSDLFDRFGCRRPHRTRRRQRRVADQPIAVVPRVVRNPVAQRLPRHVGAMPCK